MINFLTGGTSGKLQETSDSAKEFMKKMEERLLGPLTSLVSNPAETTHQIVLGIFKAFAGEGQDLEKDPTLFDCVSAMTFQFFEAAKAGTLNRFLKNAITHDLAPEDQEILKNAREAVEKADSSKKLDALIDTLKKYHILVMGKDFNPRVSSNEYAQKIRAQKEGVASLDATTPVSSLILCQEKYRLLVHRLPEALPSPDNSQISREGDNSSDALDEVSKQRRLTNGKMERITEKAGHLATMIILEFFYDKQRMNYDSYKKILNEDSSENNVATTFLEKYDPDSLTYFFFQTLYSIVHWFVSPLIKETTKNMITELRSFTEDPVRLIQFIETQLQTLSHFLGLIGHKQKEYTNKNSRPENDAGTFEKFLEKNLSQFGDQNLDKGQVLRLFKDYLISFIPKPTIEVFDERIPLLSAFLEWLVHLIHKSIARHVMHNTQWIENSLKLGNEIPSLSHQIDLQKMMQNQLTKLQTSLSSSKDTPTVSLPQSVEFRLKELAEKLSGFIQITHAGSDDQKLANIDNPVRQVFSDVIQAVAELFNVKAPCFDDVAKEAIGQILRQTLCMIWNDKHSYLESLLQNTLDLVDGSMKATIPLNKETEFQIQLNELTTAQNNITVTVQDITTSAVNQTIQNQASQYSVEASHHRIQEYVAKRKEEFVQLNNFIGDKIKSLQYRLKEREPQFLSPEELKEMKGELKELVEEVSTYLQKLSAELSSSEFSNCYGDVIGDLNNIYASTLHDLLDIHRQLENFIENIETIAPFGEENKKGYDVIKKLNDYLNDLDKANTQEETVLLQIEIISEEMPASLMAIEEIANEFANIKCYWKGYKEAQSEIEGYHLWKNKQDEKDLYSKQKRWLEEFEVILSELLPNLLAQYKNVEKNFTEEQAVASQAILVNVYKQLHEKKKQLPEAMQSQLHPLLPQECHIRDLKDCISPPLFQSRAPIFKVIATLKAEQEQQLLKVEEELSQLKEPEEDLDDLETNMNDCLKNLQEHQENLLGFMRRAEKVSLDTHTETLNKNLEKLNEIQNNVEECAKLEKSFVVTGYISVMDPGHSSFLINKLAGLVVPQVKHHVESMINALLYQPFYRENWTLRVLPIPKVH